MPHFELTVKPVEDLREIGRYTKRSRPAVLLRHCYREKLELALRKLSVSPRVGLKRYEDSAKCAPLPSLPILLSTFLGKMEITVLRLLHPNMDLANRITISLKICPHPVIFSLRFFKSDKLPDDRAARRAIQ